MYGLSTRAGSKSNQLQLHLLTFFKSITITPFQFQLQLHLYDAEPFVNYVACVLLIVCTNSTIDKQI